jgi:hypothetical protein
MGSTASAMGDNLRSMPAALREDIQIGFGRMEPTEGFNKRTKQREAREADAIRDFQLYKEDDRPRQPAPARAAPAPNYGMAPVAAAPTVPDPDAIGETEQALLDQQKAGRSSTIATSAKGLLSGDDSTRKRRSLMGSLIT